MAQQKNSPIALSPTTFTPLGGKKADLAYDMLKRAIILRRYAPETQLLEQTLAAEFQCSQSTVREALLRLAEDGLVTRRGYRGTIVTKTELEEAATMVRVRLAIERDVARAIATHGLGDFEAQLISILAAMDKAHADDDLFLGSELDRQFHCTLAEATGRGLLSPVLRRCALHIHRFTLGSVEVPREFYQEAGLGNEHRALLDCICTSDADKAEAAIVEHLANVLRRWSPSLLKATGEDAFAPRRKGSA